MSTTESIPEDILSPKGDLRQIPVIAGPTSSGKSNYAMKLASALNGTIINADAFQIYKDYPILTDQPSESDKSLVPHKLYGFIDIREQFSIASWANLLKQEVQSLKSQNKIPIIVGGTSMYIYLLLAGLVQTPRIEEEERNAKDALYETMGHEDFLAMVLKSDPNTPTDKQRLIRNHILIQKSGETLHDWSQKERIKPLGEQPLHLIAIMPDRAKVYEKCNTRFETMLESGVITEVQNSINKLGEDFTAKRMNGYVEIRDYILGKHPKSECIRIATKGTRIQAKQQYTWLNGKLKPYINTVISHMQR